ncbi:hydantoinase [Halobacteriales archaeon QS_8_69_26]|nr:MAG: hydantoinase [Halobacteriales archaeon QS_8_69_26]
MTVRIGVDTGGTFTDVIVYDPAAGETRVVKTPSTPPEFERGVLTGIDEALAKADEDPGAVEFLSHGTTVGTNAVLEGELPPVGLVTNEGLRDVLAIGDQTRPALYDLQAEKPDPPVERRLRYGVPGRIGSDGEVVDELDEEAVRSVARELAGEDPEVVVVSTLFSFLNPDHEERIGTLLEAEGLDPVLSSAVHPEIREYDRTVTTALNAAVRSTVRSYLDDLSAGVEERGIEVPVNVMHSGGGLFSTAEASRMAIRTVLSGPAAGAVATREAATAEGYADAVGMDMGGTSADVSLVRDGELARTTEGEVNDLPLKTPMIDVTTVGAGGGSVAWLDAGGALRVGPESSGADPGPVCYGRGGDRPTLTDANLLLGRINPEYFLDGEMSLAVEETRTVFERDLAGPLGRSVEEAALATVRVANASLAREIRRATVERGLDPSGFALVAFGGAGPLQAAAVAAETGMEKALIPPSPGVFSARGLLVADVRVDEARSYRGPLAADRLAEAFAGLESTLRERTRDQGFDTGDVAIERAIDLRYEGQSYELTVDVDDPLDGATVDRARDRFHRAHERRYGHANYGEPVEPVTLRATARVTTPELRVEAGTGDRDPERGTREVYFEGGFRTARIYRRTALSPGSTVEGPAVLEEAGSTTLVPPDATASVSGRGGILVDPAARDPL